MKGSIFEENLFGKIRLRRLAIIRWLFVWGKGITFKESFWGINPDNRDMQYMPINFFSK